MTQKDNPEVDGRTERSGEGNSCFDTIEDKAREALKHSDPEQACDFDVQVHIREYDSDRDVTEHLIQVNHEWIAVQTWPEASGTTGVTVTETGKRLGTDALELDQNRVAVHICREALNVIDAHNEVEQSAEPYHTLVRFAGDIAEGLASRWRSAAKTSVRLDILNGDARWTGGTAWTTHQNAISTPADEVSSVLIDDYMTCDVSDDVEATIQEICEQALFEAVVDCFGCRTESIGYAAEVILSSAPRVFR